MKKLLLSVSVLLVSFAFTASAHALNYQFSGDAYGGIASANMEVTISGNQATIIINNTSPRRFIDGTAYNAPAIDGFGFNLGSLTKTNITAWSLSAYLAPSSSTPAIIGGSDTGASKAWSFGSITGESLNFILTSSYVPQGYLYSPNTGSYLAGPYYTAATLTMIFDQNIEGFTDPLVSFKNVGKGGEGELTLIPTPEPGTLLLLGIGLIGIAIVMREML